MGIFRNTLHLIKAAVSATIVACYEVYARQVPEQDAMTQEDFAKEVERALRNRVETYPDKEE